LASQSFRVKNSLEVGTGVTITSGGNITAGVVTATSFVGSGSQLTQIVVSTVVGGAISATSLSVTGVSTFDGAVKIRNGYNLNLGDNNDLRIYNDGENSRIQETGSGTFYISGSDINIQQDSTNKNFARFVGGGAAELYYNDSKKFETSGIGITVTGTINSNQINVSGVVTASSFSGNASSATYATSAGIATYSTSSGIATYSTSSGIATYATSSGISTYATSSGIATYATSSGIATVAQGLTETPNITVGIVTATGDVLVSGVVTATTYYGDISNTVSGRWVLGASGSSDYTFTGIGFTQTTNDPTLYLKRGEVYEFVNNSGGSHPFQIRVSNGGAAYNNGVTNNGASSGTIIFQVPYNAPDTLYYQCTNHSAMGGDIIVLGGVRSIPQNSQTSAYILAASDIGKHVSITTGGVTINTGIFSAGDAVSIYNNSGSNQTITQGTSVTLRQAGTANTGNRTLAQYGVCTVLCVGSEIFVISGAGLS
jgi:hypothetical protein